MVNKAAPSEGKDIARWSPGQVEKLEKLKEGVKKATEGADKESPEQAAAKKLQDAIDVGMNEGIIRALRTLKQETKFDHLRKDMDDLRAEVGDSVEAGSVYAEKGASYLYNQLPRWTRIPLAGSIVGGTVIGLSYPIYWLGRLFGKKENAFAQKMQKWGKWIIGGSVAAGLAAGAYDMYKDGPQAAVLPEGLRGNADPKHPQTAKALLETKAEITKDQKGLQLPKIGTFDPPVEQWKVRVLDKDNTELTTATHEAGKADTVGIANGVNDEKRAKVEISFKLRGSTEFDSVNVVIREFKK